MELDKDYNKGQYLIPQILTNSVQDFFKLSGEIKQMGYNELNINIGCPSATVTSKGRGSGFLQDTKAIDKFFYEIFEKTVDIKISIKTRIGFCDYTEWDDLVKVYEKYNFCEIIIHPRLRSDFYKNKVYIPAFIEACKILKSKLVYNGDINTMEDFKILNEQLKENKVDTVMIGRGLVRNPLLPEAIKTGAKITDLRKTVDFLDDIKEEYLSLDFGERNTLFKLKELWGMVLSDEKYSKILKRIRKADTINKYKKHIEELRIS